MSSNLHRFAGIQLTSVSLMYLTPLPFIYIVDTVHMRNTSMKEVALVAQKACYSSGDDLHCKHNSRTKLHAQYGMVNKGSDIIKCNNILRITKSVSSNHSMH